MLRGTDGAVRFDSDEKLFQGTDRATGSLSLGPWTATSTNGVRNTVSTNSNHFLKTVNAHCDTVVGAFRLTSVGDPDYGVGGLGWFNASGTYMHYLGGEGGVTFDYGFVALTFFCSGGGLYLNERVELSASQPQSGGITITHQVLGLTMQYNLYCGSFV